MVLMKLKVKDGTVSRGTVSALAKQEPPSQVLVEVDDISSPIHRPRPNILKS